MPGIAFEVIPDMKLRVVNVTLVMTDGPFGGLLGPDRIGPPEPYDTGTDGDAEPSGFGLGAATLSAASPRFRGLEQCRCRRDHLGAREPQPQRVDRS
ncbi:hypothetical protein OS121_13325 [Mycolicibacterium mucogenicum]|uniref:hypothetical protein n=1 Tax=Mycolicibacterium mucogenicum TaxID=56689 RepID=UPI00226A40B2|nr:hypothetical protein [Mycolicibacterium mucogenicum]MCX8556060.1 hypothetical protein [Mycolicibacterium mucogenicum]